MQNTSDEVKIAGEKEKHFASLKVSDAAVSLCCEQR